MSDQTRLRQLVAPRQGLLPIRILERQSGQRRRQPRYRARAPHVGSLAASVGLGNQRVAQTSWTPPPLRDQRWQRPEARLEHRGTAAAVQCRRERQRKRPAEWDRWHHGSALFPIRRAGHLMGSRLEPRHSQLRRRDSRQSVLNGIPSPLSRGRRVAQALPNGPSGRFYRWYCTHDSQPALVGRELQQPWRSSRRRGAMRPQ